MVPIDFHSFSGVTPTNQAKNCSQLGNQQRDQIINKPGTLDRTYPGCPPMTSFCALVFRRWWLNLAIGNTKIPNVDWHMNPKTVDTKGYLVYNLVVN